MYGERTSEESPRTKTTAVVVDAQAEHLQRHFAEYADGRCMVLFDPSVRDARSDASVGSSIKERLYAEIAISYPQFPKKHRPYLLPLNLASYADSKLLRASVRMAFEDRDSSVVGRCQGHRVGGWLASNETADATASHFAKHAMQGAGRKLPFRFFDMRCMSWLWPLLRPAQQRTLFGPVTGWHIFDATHHLRHLASSADATISGTLELDAQQWSLMARIGGVNRALARYQHECGDTPSKDYLPIAWSAAGRAIQFGLHDPEDMAALILCALRWHPQLDRHPKIRAALEQRKPGQSGQAALAKYDDADIQRFVQELNHITMQGEQ